MYCQNSDGQGTKWRDYVDELPGKDHKYICTTDEGYGKTYEYAKSLERWIDNNCK